MRFTLTTGLGDYEDWQAMASAAEEAGFASFSIPDSTFFPLHTDSVYPYDDTAVVRRYAEHTPFIDPMIALPWLAAGTRKLRFYPNVMKVPTRSPIVLAKELGSLAVISGNRVALGAGIGTWKEDFAYNNLDWSARGRLFDECLDIIKGLLGGGFFEYHGKHFDFGPIKINPVPTQPLKIILGGHSEPALRRAARIGDGWVSVKGSEQEFKSKVDKINAYRSEYSTRDRPFEFHFGNFDFQPGAISRSLEDYRRLEQSGATDFCLLPFLDPTAKRAQKIDTIRRFGAEVISLLD
jgi:probable F420-dependent oxidoreductase